MLFKPELVDFACCFLVFGAAVLLLAACPFLVLVESCLFLFKGGGE